MGSELQHQRPWRNESNLGRRREQARNSPKGQQIFKETGLTSARPVMYFVLGSKRKIDELHQAVAFVVWKYGYSHDTALGLVVRVWNNKLERGASFLNYTEEALELMKTADYEKDNILPSYWSPIPGHMYLITWFNKKFAPWYQHIDWSESLKRTRPSSIKRWARATEIALSK